MSAVTAQPQPGTDHGLETVHIIAQRDDGLAKVAHLSWARSNNPGDASLYIRPFLGQGWTAKGAVTQAVPLGADMTVTADREVNAVFDEAKISLHHTGQTHVYVGPRRPRNRLPAVHGLPLDDPAGGHVASIVCFDLAELPLLERGLEATTTNIDYVVPAPGQGTARLNVAIFTGTDEQKMRDRYQFLQDAQLLYFEREKMDHRLYFGIRCGFFDGPLQHTPGVTVIGGWGPGVSTTEEIPMVSLWVGPNSTEPTD
ncbi:hypothetical protein C7M71_000030 [Peterkaempfera bronchialis]|uniref:Uncharacterized protein n=1 Tax=Peterkaempfera bronchialis TaxID=2126346 RepID=A0A345SQV4_9ACTN|nr:hypothetical protein C7M71_000030 [Peterkaempfera bronchialis]